MPQKQDHAAFAGYGLLEENCDDNLSDLAKLLVCSFKVYSSDRKSTGLTVLSLWSEMIDPTLKALDPRCRASDSIIDSIKLACDVVAQLVSLVLYTPSDFHA